MAANVSKAGQMKCFIVLEVRKRWEDGLRKQHCKEKLNDGRAYLYLYYRDRYSRNEGCFRQS